MTLFTNVSIYANKRIILIILLLLAFNNSITFAQVQWQKADVFHGRTVNSVKYIDASTSIVAGGFSLTNAAIRYGNRGTEVTSYSDFDSVSREKFTDVSFPTTNIGYLSGWKGNVIKTENNANSWFFISRYMPTSVSTKNYNGVAFITTQLGYLVGGDDTSQTIIKTTDGGYSWSIQKNMNGAILNSVYFFDANNGIAVGKNGLILKTNDGGNNWNTVVANGTAANRHFNKIIFQNSTSGIIVGGGDYEIQSILKTTDGGNTWNTIVDDTTGFALNGVAYRTAQDVYAVGNGAIIKESTDGGNTWSSLVLPDSINDPFNNLRTVHFANEYTGAFGGDNGKLFVYLGNLPPVPSVTTDSAKVNSVDNTIQFFGSVNPNGTNIHALFEYGTSPNELINTVAVTPDTLFGNSIQSISAISPVLEPNIYYYRIKASNNWSDAVGQVKQITFGLPGPSVKTDSAVINVVNNTATLYGSINPNGVATKAYFEFGNSPFLGTIYNLTDSVRGINNQSVSITTSALTPGTYFYRLHGASRGGDSIGNIQQFSINIPTLLTGDAIINSNKQVKLNGAVNPNGSSVNITFEYGTTTAFGNSINVAGNPHTGTSNIAVSAITPILSDGIYYYRIKVSGAYTDTGNIRQFYIGQNPISNFDFEYWYNDTVSFLDGWNLMSVHKGTSYDGSTSIILDGSENKDGFGIALLGSFGDGGPAGGYPFTSRPDSAVAYIKYSVSSTAPGLFGVIFKKDGNPISMSPYQIGTTAPHNSNGEFERISIPIDFPDSTITPDSVIIILLSSDLLITQAVDPTNVIEVDNISFIGTTENIINYNFETWNDIVSEYPTLWNTSDMQMYPPMPIKAVTKTTDAKSNQYAIKLQNNIANGIPALVQTNSPNGYGPSFAVNQKFTTLNGFYKYFSEGDTALISIEMYKQGNRIGGGTKYFINTTSEYTAFSDTIFYYQTNDTPDSASISIRCFKEFNQNGGGVYMYGNSALYIDKLTFDGISDSFDLVTSIKNNFLHSNTLKLYPNPANDYITLELPTNEVVKNITIFDIKGATYLAPTISTMYNNIQMFNVNTLEPGLYIIRTETEQGIYTNKFIISR